MAFDKRATMTVLVDSDGCIACKAGSPPPVGDNEDELVASMLMGWKTHQKPGRDAVSAFVNEQLDIDSAPDAEPIPLTLCAAHTGGIIGGLKVAAALDKTGQQFIEVLDAKPDLSTLVPLPPEARAQAEKGPLVFGKAVPDADCDRCAIERGDKAPADFVEDPRQFYCLRHLTELLRTNPDAFSLKR